MIVIGGLLFLLTVIGAIGAALEEEKTSTAPPTTTSSTTTTTLPPGLPPGDDTTVSRVIDGDTIEVAGGTSVRLIGIDTPETGTCFSSESTAHTAELLPSGMRVRLAHDVERRDQYGRMLAYVYRLTDGLFVNLAMARDGFAVQLTVPPNVAHAEEFRAAVAEAQGAGRGLWAACTTTTTTAAPPPPPPTAPPATRRAPAAPPPPPPPAAPSGVYYDNCTAARAAGAAPLYRGQPGYRAGLDRDNDGVACE